MAEAREARFDRGLVVFTKPARPGAVKTRLIGDLSAEDAADLHGAFLGDLLERLAGGQFEISIAWALEEEESLPSTTGGGGGAWRGPGRGPAAFRQEGDDLGDRLLKGLAQEAARPGRRTVVAVGSDHPELAADRIESAFERLEMGADCVLGPARDGGYYLIGFPVERIPGEVFAGIPWSTGDVLERTLDRCRALGLRTECLPEGEDIDTIDDLRRLAGRLGGQGQSVVAPRTHRKLLELGFL